MNTQRINIQYSINLEELPNEVERLYSQAVTRLGEAQLPKLGTEEILTSSTVKVIDQIRKQLTQTDAVLSDVQSIISSYVEYELSLSQPQEQAPPIPEDLDENTD
tara:strand:+ start:605 stop:919 length:315 start_codon:yes stop_codon:yes gene_type:complete